MSDAPLSQNCSSCKCHKPAECFKLVHGKRKQTCHACLAKKTTKKKQNSSEETGPSTVPDVPSTNDAFEDDTDLSIVTPEDFFAVIAMDENARSLGAIIDAEQTGKMGKELADLNALEIPTALVIDLCEHDLRSTTHLQILGSLHSKYEHKNSHPVRYMYHCAQIESRQHKSKKVDNEDKHRDKRQMATFPCAHEDDHVPYYSRDVPVKVKEFVTQNPRLRAAEIWNWVLDLPEYQDRMKILFSRRAVYYLWNKKSREKWYRDDNELKSAKIIIEEASAEARPHENGPPLFRVEPVPLPDINGFSAIAFVLPEPLRKWGGRVRELALDSAWETNQSQYEVFAILGEVSESGCPLGYLLIKTRKDSEPGGKQTYLEHVLEYLQATWKTHSIATLSDKDWSEINACLAKFKHLNSRHQLCFWHGLRAVKKRLAVVKRQPAPYDWLEACREFDFIDTKFVPIGQATEAQSVPNVPETAIPHLKIVEPPPPRWWTGPTIRINGALRTLEVLNQEPSVDTAAPAADEDNEFTEDVEALIRGEEPERTDGPDWMFEADETATRDPNYIFCPPQHRTQVLRIFTRIFVRHPFFPERNGARPAQSLGIHVDILVSP
ncbi:hypothetical protein GGX14DRAFT_561334 [Mycena pura]|uniref:MULE transposase domain-containing protein n=1 Tax=Mycena pura TaxID=153505 RepID=A0AAD6VN80_9AGAR|nr:hypothetical protein GGX14DRAFT_561334 [Mycena pura]